MGEEGVYRYSLEYITGVAVGSSWETLPSFSGTLTLKISSMKATSASGKYPRVWRTYLSSSSARMDSGPNSSCVHQGEGRRGSTFRGTHPCKQVPSGAKQCLHVGPPVHSARVLLTADVTRFPPTPSPDPPPHPWPLKVGARDELVQAAADLALGSARRPNEQDVLAAHGREEEQAHLQGEEGGEGGERGCPSLMAPLE